MRTLDRGLRVLEALSTMREATISAVAAEVSLSSATTYRLLETLKHRRFVAQTTDNGLYHVGIRAFEVGSALSRMPLHKVAQAEMNALAEEVNETINLAVLDGREAVIVSQVSGNRFMRLLTHLGARVPLHCTGVGKMLLAHRPVGEIRELLGSGSYQRVTKNTFTTAASLQRELHRIRQRDYALDDEEREPGVRCLAVPVRTGSGEVVAALSIAAPAARVDNAKVKVLAGILRRSSERISAQLCRR